MGLQLTRGKEADEALAKDGVCYEEYMINDYEIDLPIKAGKKKACPINAHSALKSYST